MFSFPVMKSSFCFSYVNIITVPAASFVDDLRSLNWLRRSFYGKKNLMRRVFWKMILRDWQKNRSWIHRILDVYCFGCWVDLSRVTGLESIWHSNCLFHAMSDQLTRVGRAPKKALQLRCGVISYLRSYPTKNLLIVYAGIVRRKSMDGEWGDWIAWWGLTKMLNIPVALVSSQERQRHEADVHFHSFEPASDTANPKKGERERKGKVT